MPNRRLNHLVSVLLVFALSLQVVPFLFSLIAWSLDFEFDFLSAAARATLSSWITPECDRGYCAVCFLLCFGCSRLFAGAGQGRGSLSTCAWSISLGRISSSLTWRNRPRVVCNFEVLHTSSWVWGRPSTDLQPWGGSYEALLVGSRRRKVHPESSERCFSLLAGYYTIPIAISLAT
jgi:hypothetical protein